MKTAVNFETSNLQMSRYWHSKHFPFITLAADSISVTSEA